MRARRLLTWSKWLPGVAGAAAACGVFLPAEEYCDADRLWRHVTGFDDVFPA